MRLLIFNLRMDAEDGVLGFTTDWVNALAKHCEQVYVVTMEVGALRVADNVEVFSVGKERGLGKLAMLGNLYRHVGRILRDGRIDAAFAHMNYLFALLAAPLLKLSGKPIVLWYAHGAVPLLLRPTEMLVDRIVASSASGFRLKTRKLTVIGQGIDTRRFAPVAYSNADGCRLLTLGRISRIKRLEVVIDAVAKLATTAPALKLTCDIVGDPLTADGQAYQRELEQRIRDCGVSERVRILPGVPFTRAHSEFARADLFINSADTDSVDKTVLEAMSSGTRVLTSNAAFHEIFPEAIRALCWVPKNDVDALARSIQIMCSQSPDARVRLERQGREMVVTDHSLERLADKLVAQIHMATSGRSGG